MDIVTVPGVGAMRPGALGDSLEAEVPIALPLHGGAAVHLSIEARPDGAPAGGVAQAVAALLALGLDARAAMTDAVWDDYLSMLSAYLPGEVPCEIGAHERDRVWEHLRPRHCSVGAAGEGRTASVTLHCDTDWDPEHGIILTLAGGTEFVHDRWARAGEND